MFQDFKIMFQFYQDLLFTVICERKCNPGSETASLMSWLCAEGLGFPETPGCGGAGVPRNQSWPRNLGIWMLWLPWALKLLAFWLFRLKFSQELSNLGGPGICRSQNILFHRSLQICSVALCRAGSLEIALCWATQEPGSESDKSCLKSRFPLQFLYLNCFHEIFLQQ